jgi:hypothetical protein
VAGDKVECEWGQKATNKLKNWLTLSKWHSSTTGMGGFSDNFAHFHGSGAGCGDGACCGGGVGSRWAQPQLSLPLQWLKGGAELCAVRVPSQHTPPPSFYHMHASSCLPGFPAGMTEEGQAAPGMILRIQVRFAFLPCASYITFAQPPPSTHSWYNSRRWEVTEQRGGGDLTFADAVAVRLQACVAAGSR